MARAIFPGKQDDEQGNAGPFCARKANFPVLAEAKGPRLPKPSESNMAKIAQPGVAKPCKGVALSAASLLDLGDFGPYHTSFCL